VLFMMR
jgi:hypothetical protein